MVPKWINVSITYAHPQQQRIIDLRLPEGTNARQAVEQSGIAREFSEIDLSCLVLGIYSRRVPLTHPLEDGDRVEIYRPLQIDPKESRRQRAARLKTGKAPR